VSTTMACLQSNRAPSLPARKPGHLLQTKAAIKLLVYHGFNIFLTERVSVAVSLEVRSKSKDAEPEHGAGARGDPAIGPQQIVTAKYSVENAASILSALVGAGITRINSIGSSMMSAAFIRMLVLL
jgi:hypothetical protein